MLSVFVSHNGSSPFGFTSSDHHPKEDDDDDDEKKKTIIDSTTSKSASCTAAANEATRRTIAKRTAIFAPRDPNPLRRFFLLVNAFDVDVVVILSRLSQSGPSLLLPTEEERYGEKKSIQNTGPFFFVPLHTFNTLNSEYPK
tara:strand:- start:162 stop:587 length:426 start_codon:yes stop_codon:yes gene_type:complete